jgi:hypothetical protein
VVELPPLATRLVQREQIVVLGRAPLPRAQEQLRQEVPHLQLVVEGLQEQALWSQQRKLLQQQKQQKLLQQQKLSQQPKSSRQQMMTNGAMIWTLTIVRQQRLRIRVQFIARAHALRFLQIAV